MEEENKRLKKENEILQLFRQKEVKYQWTAEQKDSALNLFCARFSKFPEAVAIASPDLNLATSNLERAYKKEKITLHSIPHGWIYQQRGSSYGITLFMLRKGNCYDNSVIEGFSNPN